MPPGCSGAGRPEKRVTARSRRAPEEMHRAALPGEARSKDLEDPIRLHQHAPEPVRVLGIVSAVDLVLREGDRLGDLVRLGVNLHVQVERRSSSSISRA